MMKFDINDEVVAEYLAMAEGDHISDVSMFEDDVINALLLDDDTTGDPMPWGKTSGNIRFRPGEVTIWAGINGHKKSMITGQIALWLLPHAKVTMASMEMKPAKTITRMLQQARGCFPESRYASDWIYWATGRLSIYDQLDAVATDRILAMTHYAAKTIGSHHIFIDSLMKCISGTDDYNAQKNFINRITQLAKIHNIHIHIVHHMRKGDSEEKIPDKWAVKGAGEITDQVDNLIIVHCNKRKERMKDQGEDFDVNDRDMTLRVAKQRHGEWEGDIPLWFDSQSLQHVSKPGYGAMPWPWPNSDNFLDIEVMK